MTVQQQPNTFRAGPDERGHFGIYGGRFVAETLMPLILALEKAYAEHSNIVQWMKVHPFMDPLREDPRFKDLLHRVGLDRTY